ncbi:hypothetical protein DFH28DRAFT_923687 [Melampsora americana]|nr:hypothetical protein DFH28DRAFT_923687 [Melampsora americana]
MRQENHWVYDHSYKVDTFVRTKLPMPTIYTYSINHSLCITLLLSMLPLFNNIAEGFLIAQPGKAMIMYLYECQQDYTGVKPVTCPCMSCQCLCGGGAPMAYHLVGWKSPALDPKEGGGRLQDGIETITILRATMVPCVVLCVAGFIMFWLHKVTLSTSTPY